MLAWTAPNSAGIPVATLFVSGIVKAKTGGTTDVS